MTVTYRVRNAPLTIALKEITELSGLCGDPTTQVDYNFDIGAITITESEVVIYSEDESEVGTYQVLFYASLDN